MYLGPFKSSSVLHEVSRPSDDTSDLTRAWGGELHLGILGKCGQVFQYELLPELGCFHQSHLVVWLQIIVLSGQI